VNLKSVDEMPQGKRRVGERVPVSPPTPQTIPGVKLAADVELRAIEWLWRHWLPRGSISFFDGDPGLGKSTLVVDLVARITRGDPMPDGTAGLGRAGFVVLVLGEDTEATARARLEAAGADLMRVAIIDHIPDEKGDPRTVILPDDLAHIERVVRCYSADVVAFDPWFAFLSSSVDTNKDASARLALTPTAKMAEATSATVVALRHLNKSKGSALQRGMGSTAHTAAARSVLLAGVDPADEKRCVLSIAKSNLGPRPRSIGFSTEGTISRPDGSSIVDSKGRNVETSRIVWHGVNAANAEDLVKQPDERDEHLSKKDRATAFLRTELAAGPVLTKDLQAAARQADIAWATVRRAADAMGIEPGKEGRFDGQWRWSLPTEGEQDAQAEHHEHLEQHRVEDAQNSTREHLHDHLHSHRRERDERENEGAHPGVVSDFGAKVINIETARGAA
jgi:putative DNA primase/helicase